MKTTKFVKTAEANKKWILIDAEDVVVGRLATFVAMRLRGKHLPTYTPHIDHGDNVIIINAEKVSFTGKKRSDKVYYWHTGYPGGIKDITAGKLLAKSSTEMVRKSIKGMLPRGPLGYKQLKNLYVYSGAEHDQAAQKPVTINFSDLNDKNNR